MRNVVAVAIAITFLACHDGYARVVSVQNEPELGGVIACGGAEGLHYAEETMRQACDGPYDIVRSDTGDTLTGTVTAQQVGDVTVAHAHSRREVFITFRCGRR